MQSSTDGAVVVFDDDAEAKALIAHYGRMPAFTLHREHPRLFVWWGDPEINAYFCAAQYRGFARPEDNGFVVWCFDLNRLTAEQVGERIRIITENGRDWSRPATGVEYHEWTERGN